MPNRCYCPGKMLVIQSNGEVWPCEYLNKKMGSLRDFNYDIRKVFRASSNGDIPFHSFRAVILAKWPSSRKECSISHTEILRLYYHLVHYGHLSLEIVTGPCHQHPASSCFWAVTAEMVMVALVLFHSHPKQSPTKCRRRFRIRPRTGNHHGRYVLKNGNTNNIRRKNGHRTPPRAFIINSNRPVSHSFQLALFDTKTSYPDNNVHSLDKRTGKVV